MALQDSVSSTQCIVVRTVLLYEYLLFAVLGTDNQIVNFVNDNPITPNFRLDIDNPRILIPNYRKVTNPITINIC